MIRPPCGCNLLQIKKRVGTTKVREKGNRKTSRSEGRKCIKTKPAKNIKRLAIFWRVHAIGLRKGGTEGEERGIMKKPEEVRERL